jgi:hypothetical protein
VNGSSRPRSFRLALILAASLTLLPQIALAAWPHDPNNGNVPVCAASGTQYYQAIASDGAGGAFVAWMDDRNGAGYDVYAQHVSATGAMLWTVNGVAVCTATGDQDVPMLVADGAGGAIVTWYDFRSGTEDIYAQRFNAAGVAQWTANGVAICTAVGSQVFPVLVSDGAGGAIIGWQDNRNGSSPDIFAQRVNAAGATQWTANGVAVCTSGGSQTAPTIASDGSGGAILAWTDARSGTLDIYAQRVNGAGTTLWTLNGASLCNATSDQYTQTMIADGAGGAIVCWEDGRGSSGFDIYAQRVNAAGVTAWQGNGLAVCAASIDQTYPVIATDGSGGAIIAWQDSRNGPTNVDIYAQRVSANGAPQWLANGVGVRVTTNSASTPQICADGFGGAIITWPDFRNGAIDVYAQRVSGAGSPMWDPNGMAISTAAGNQNGPVVVTDGAGGAVFAWQDNRALAASDIYAQRIDSFGNLGSPEPTLTTVADTPNDQGGHVKLTWTASYLDAPPYLNIDSYWILRATPPNLVADAVRDGALLVSRPESEPAPGARLFLASSTGTLDYAWEYVASQPAFHVSTYSYVAATTSDSVAGSNPLTQFMVMARTIDGTQYWFSAPDSGYSVDNLPPSTPAPFVAAYSGGATHLHWSENHEADLAGYRLYRGASSSFVPGPGNRIASPPDTGFADAGPAGSWYKLSAVDSHGNESPFATLGPNGTLAVPDGAAVALYFAPPSPSPTRGGATFRFGLPREGAVELALYDEAGRLVRELARGDLTAGDHQVKWDGRDSAGRLVADGLYFARLDGAGRALVTKLVEIR